MSVAYHCPNCPDTFTLDRVPDDAPPPWPKDWHLFVVHNHDERAGGVWEGSLFYHPKGSKWPEAAKRIQAAQVTSRKQAKEAKQVANNSRPGNRKGIA